MNQYQKFVQMTYQESTESLLDKTLLDQIPCELHNDYIFVVNIASECGLFEKIYNLNNLDLRTNITVIGQPSDDFNQEPVNSANIKDFYRELGIGFHILNKNTIFDKIQNPLYHELIKKSNQKPKWNFHVYLLDTTKQKIYSFCHLLSIEEILDKSEIS